jgi:hypothetical protein
MRRKQNDARRQPPTKLTRRSFLDPAHLTNGKASGVTPMPCGGGGARFQLHQKIDQSDKVEEEKVVLHLVRFWARIGRKCFT